ncbi:rRNA N(6)-adenosine-methyltransferase ZCCHC4 [Hetaerina americana]|uniref:rRNA N(6)-adenosine-methyltransferase ZCCHC4 n=1 Tax=Hetaerina americana TaxID=62018 RepID=UPI003A7F2E6C
MDDEQTFSPSIRVIMGDVESHPRCLHGPTLLFARTVKGGKERKFYACSACRSRKDCSFFMWENEHEAKIRKQLGSPRDSSQYGFTKCTNTISKFIKLSARKRGYCHTCNCLFNVKEKEKHCNHDALLGVSDHLIRRPSKLLKQLESSKKEAQYMFSDRSVNFIYSTLKKLNVTFVICIGAPRIHEYISVMPSSIMKTLLLDIDERYYNFYGSDQFCHYNMFNNYFFGGEHARKLFLSVLRDESNEIAVVIDPPFGGRVEPLSFTLQSLQELRQDLTSSSASPIPVLWAFPYFMEPYIRGMCPNFTMLDYKVDYENHIHFKTGGNKRGSPVRIFTNVSASKIPLPETEGYCYCSICDRWIAPENKHCQFCNACTSKDGRTYKHCKICGRCVKPAWIHCADCGRCCLPIHNCGQEPAQPVACFCGSLNHLSKECPLKGNNLEKHRAKKRKTRETKESKKKKCRHNEQQIQRKDSKEKDIN